MTCPADTTPTASQHVPRSLDPAIPSHPSEFSCIDLINSAFTNHLGMAAPIDRLPLTAWQSWFLDRHGFGSSELSAAPVDQLAALRRRLRRLLDRWARTGSLSAKDAGQLDRWLSSATLRQRVATASDVPAVVLEPVTPDWTWVMAMIAASAVELISHQAPSRLKVCANHDCSWMFYDHSPNISRRFCSTSPCASVVRVRRFRNSARGVEPRTPQRTDASDSPGPARDRRPMRPRKQLG